MMKGEHTVKKSGFEIVYWQGHTACGHLDAWDRAEIVTYSGAYRWSYTVTNKSDLDNICIILDRVFVAGMKEKTKHFRELLGVE